MGEDSDKGTRRRKKRRASVRIGGISQSNFANTSMSDSSTPVNPVQPSSSSVMGDVVARNEQELAAIAEIADSDQDRPVLMLNLNRYTDAAGFPDGALYQRYMSVLEGLLPQVGAKVLWRTPVFGQPVGEQPLDEILAAWYPSHRAFLDLPDAPDGKENFRLRHQCVEYAVIHRCDDQPVKKTPA